MRPPKHRFHFAQLLIFVVVGLVIFAWGCGYQKKKQSFIGRDPTWYPVNLAGKTEQINAFTNALVGAIGKGRLRIVDIDPLSLLQSLENKEMQGILSSISPDGENSDLYDFSDPFLLLGPVLILPKDSAAASLEDLGGKMVGINPFDGSILSVQKIPSIIIKKYTNMPTALDDLSEGKIDGVLLGDLEARALIPSFYADKLCIASPPLNDKGLRLVVLKDTQKELLFNFNNGLKKSIESGEYEKLLQQFQIRK